jgi:glycosyltransferase involved in cell wall biosynthesis
VADMCEDLGVPWHLDSFDLRNTRNGWLLAFDSIEKSLQRARPDILLPYTFVPNVICGLGWQRTGARACVWNQRDGGLTPFVAEWARAAAERTPVFISNARAGAEFLVRELGVDPLKVRVIENGIEQSTANDDRSQWRAKLGIGDESFVACMVANLHANKDHATLLRAWRRVTDHLNGRNAVLVLAGRYDGAYESLLSLSRELNLTQRVRFAGQVLDVPGLLSAADVGVFSSYIEGCPNGVLESMAAGLAVAGTDVDAIRSVVGRKGLQFLAPPKDDEALAVAILKLANDSDLRVTLGAENERRVREKYTAPRMCESTVAVMKEALSNVP